MRRHGITLLALLLTSGTVNASDYQSVRSRADNMANMLGSEQKMEMTQAKTEHLQEVINTCDNRVGEMHGHMGVVLRIDADGQIADRWFKNATTYERCFGGEMEVRLDYDPPIDPFFMAFDYGG